MVINEWVIIHCRKVVDHGDEVVIRNNSTHSVRNLIVITAVLSIFHGMGFIATWFIFKCVFFFASTQRREGFMRKQKRGVYSCRRFTRILESEDI